MGVSVGEQSRFSLDTWMALLSGGSPWATGEQRDDAWSRLLTFVELFAIATTVSTLWWAGHINASSSPAIVGTVALCLVAIPPLMRLIMHDPWPRSLPFNLIARATLLTMTCMSIYALLPKWNSLWSTPFAIAIGIDISLTCSELGWRARPLVW